MNIDKKVFSSLGFSIKAGKAVSGEFAARKSIKSGASKLVVLEPSASSVTKERWHSICSTHGVPCVEIEGAGDAVGKDGRMVISVIGDEFAEMIVSALRNDSQNTGVIGLHDSESNNN